VTAFALSDFEIMSQVSNGTFVLGDSTISIHLQGGNVRNVIVREGTHLWSGAGTWRVSNGVVIVSFNNARHSLPSVNFEGTVAHLRFENRDLLTENSGQTRWFRR